jgi:hypothetical protein
VEKGDGAFPAGAEDRDERHRSDDVRIAAWCRCAIEVPGRRPEKKLPTYDDPWGAVA